MEAIRLKNSKITSLGHRSSTGEGNRHAQRQRNVTEFVSDSSCSSGTPDRDLVTSELGQRSAKQRVRPPRKKLLEEQLKRDVELKKHSPSVVARLMGLDEIPPQQHAYKQPRGTSGNSHHSMSPEVSDPTRDMYSGRRSCRKSSKREQQFKDVYEVLEMSKSNRSCRPSLPLTSEISEAEMAFIEQKFMDAKHLSTDEKLLSSREFDDTLEVLDSNKELLVKYFQQPDAPFTKYMHDMRAASRQSHHNGVSAKNSPDTSMHDNGGERFNFEQEASRKNRRISPRHSHTVPFTQSFSRRTACSSRKSPQIPLVEKFESPILPTRIVVLKPNLWKTQDDMETLSPLRSSHNFPTEGKNLSELRYIRCQGIKSMGKKQLSDDVALSGYRCKESRVIAKEITRKMRNSLGTGSNNFLSSGYGAYAGETSSSKIYENESVCASELTSPNSRNSFVKSNRYKPSRSRSTESSLSREAKKRISDRWKMTHKSQELGASSRGSTLGEMLATPDMEQRYNVINNGEGFNGKLSISSTDGLAGWLEPLGISSRDGCKDGSCVRNLPRSRSLPASSSVFANPKNSKHIENMFSDRFVMSKDAMKRDKDKVVNGNLNNKNVLLSSTLRPSKKKYHSSYCESLTVNDMSEEHNSNQDQQKINLEEIDSYERTSMTGSITEDMVDVGHHHITISFETSEIVVDLERQSSETEDAKHLSPMLVKSNLSIHRLEHSIPKEPSGGPSKEGFVRLHHPIADQESSASSKEADQPSPLSVLDAPFTDDISSGSECFESLSADLHGLRMQLQLLKSESDEFIEGSMLVSSDEDVEEGSVIISEQDKLSEGNWVSSYLDDVLSKSGFDSVNPKTFRSSCYSPECPISSMVYEELEKKYVDTSLLMLERRLLFDLINSGLLEIYNQLMDPHPWVSPSRTMIGPNWSKDEFSNHILKSLENQENNRNKDDMGMMLGMEPLWLDLGDDTDAVGKYIEKLLIDELVVEVVTK